MASDTNFCNGCQPFCYTPYIVSFFAVVARLDAVSFLKFPRHSHWASTFLLYMNDITIGIYSSICLQNSLNRMIACIGVL